MGGLRVLITCITLAERTGSVLYVRDLAMGLLDRGHTPIVYSTELGKVAKEIQAATIPVIGDLDALTTQPDIIHGNHHPETMTALLRFPGVPAVHTCHGWDAWEAAPPLFPRILRYIAVDFACHDRLVFEHGIPEERVRVLFNSVDLKRFKLRGPLPMHPKRALVFSNYASEQTHLIAVRKACAYAGITLDVIGEAGGNPSERPDEAVLGQYDLVFAKARCALEAMAVGTAVVLCDTAGAGPMVTTGELDRLQRLNFGRRAFRESLGPEQLTREIARYDAADAAEVTRRIRATAGLAKAVDDLLALYYEVLAEHKSAGEGNAAMEYRAVATYLRWLSAGLRGCRQLQTITDTVGWRLLIRYGSMKHRVLLPTYRRLLRLLRVETPDPRGR